MKVNYVLMYGIPYVRYREFETFEDCSKFLVNKSIVNYSIFKKLKDDEEIEMIYRDNDIHYLENFVKEQDKETERLNNIINTLEDTLSKIKDLNTMKYLRDDIFKDMLDEILKDSDKE